MTTPIQTPEKLKMIAAFWNANITEGSNRGFCIRLDDDLPNQARRIAEMVRMFEMQPRSEREDFLSGAVYAQLREASRLMWSTMTNGFFNPASLSQHDQALVMVYGLLNIAILETQGRLISDDNNGMLYMYGPGSKAHVQMPFSRINKPDSPSPRASSKG